jgi:hypothetical protein
MGCGICGVAIGFRTATVDKPGLPELFQFDDSDVWFGVARGEDGGPQLVAVCSRACRDALFSAGDNT